MLLCTPRGRGRESQLPGKENKIRKELWLQLLLLPTFADAVYAAGAWSGRKTQLPGIVAWPDFGWDALSELACGILHRRINC